MKPYIQQLSYMNVTVCEFHSLAYVAGRSNAF